MAASPGDLCRHVATPKSPHWHRLSHPFSWPDENPEALHGRFKVFAADTLGEYLCEAWE
jgi:hypothetical protein